MASIGHSLQADISRAGGKLWAGHRVAPRRAAPGHRWPAASCGPAIAPRHVALRWAFGGCLMAVGAWCWLCWLCWPLSCVVWPVLCRTAGIGGRARNDRARDERDHGNRAAGAACCWCCHCGVLIVIDGAGGQVACCQSVGCIARWLGRRAGVCVSVGVSCLAGSRAGANHVLHVLCVLEFCAAQTVLRAANVEAGVHCCWGRACAARAWCSSRVAEGSLCACGIARRGARRPQQAERDTPAPPAWRRDPFQKGFFLQRHSHSLRHLRMNAHLMGAM